MSIRSDQLISHACVPSFTSMRATVSKFEEVVQRLPEAICCCGRHGNDIIHMCTKFHLHACYS